MKKYICAMILISFTLGYSFTKDYTKFNYSFLNNYESKLTYDLEDSKYGFYTPFSDITSFGRGLQNYFLGKNKSETLVVYRGEEKKIQLNAKSSIFAGFDYQSKNGKSLNFVYYGIYLNSHLIGKHFDLYMDTSWWSGRYDGHRNEILSEGLLLNGFYKNDPTTPFIYFDELDARIRLDKSFLALEVGRNSFSIGDNIHSSIILNEDVPKYGYLNYDLVWKNFKLEFVHASLISDEKKDNQEFVDFGDRFLALHKMSYESENFSFFFGESIIYSDRSYDLSYCLPHTFFRVSEHRQGDRDNILIFLGWDFAINNIKFYQNLVFDEIKKSELFQPDWHNRYASQIGIRYSKNDFLLGAEFTNVRPWMYTHDLKDKSYSHYGDPLGFGYGSNLISYASELKFKFPFDIASHTTASYTRQGSIGNSYLMNYHDRPSDSVTWLDGDITDTYRINSSLEYSFLSRHTLKISYMHENEIDVKKYDTLYVSFLTYY